MTKVHILATCLKEALLPNTLLVFRSLRVGFPTAEVVIWGNRLKLQHAQAVRMAAQDAEFRPIDLVHDRWVEALVMTEKEPFWIVDTDVVFNSSLEDFRTTEGIAGRFEPDFIEPWTETVRVARLHTAVMFMDPGKIRRAMCGWLRKSLPEGFPFAPEIEFIRQHFVPRTGQPTLFYDTTAGLYQALGGREFTTEENAAFDHLHCGTYVDVIAQEKELANMGAVHRAIWAKPELAQNLKPAQEEFYQAQKP